MEKCVEHEICLIFLYSSVQNVFHSDKYLVSYAENTHRNACRSSYKVVVKFV
jgi:hypothetical protein